MTLGTPKRRRILPTAIGDFESSKLQPVAVAAVSWGLGQGSGFVHLLSNDLQLDPRAARRLSDDGVDLSLGAGVSCRWGRNR